MKIIYKELPSKRKRCVVTIGVFDGIHLGHQFILREVKKHARKEGISSLVITFDIPPYVLLGKKFLGYLSSFEEKKKLLEFIGIDYLWVLKVNKYIIKLSEVEFLKYISRYFCIKEMVVGDDFRFGYKGKGNIYSLKRLSRIFKFNLVILKKKRKKGEVISSSLIRMMIKKGDFKRVKMFLGREYSFRGRVRRGEGIGEKVGFPTANIDVSGYIIPPHGVYAAYVYMGKRKYLGAVNVGIRPTVSSSSHNKRVLRFSYDRERPHILPFKLCHCRFEVHIINFHRYIYGKIINVVLLEKIRREKKLPSLQKLKEEIKKDIEYILKKYSQKVCGEMLLPSTIAKI
jgi:riboflavin kinase/FMN adenylyltransferase